MPVPEADLSAAPPDPMTADPNIGAGIGNVANDPNAGMPTEDPAMDGADTDMADPGMEGGAEGGIADDSTASIIDQLSDEDKEAVRNYAESLLNRDEAAPADGMGAGMEEPAAPDQEQGVMMEITKGRLKKVQKYINEKFRENDRKGDDERKAEKVNKDFRKKTPFDSPVK